MKISQNTIVFPPRSSYLSFINIDRVKFSRYKLKPDIEMVSFDTLILLYKNPPGDCTARIKKMATKVTVLGHSRESVEKRKDVQV